MAWAKLKTAATVGASLLLLTGTIEVAFKVNQPTRVATNQNTPGIRQLLDDANESLVRWEVPQYEETLRRAWQRGGDAADRTDAAVALARDLWRIQHKPAAARKILAAARALNAKPAVPLLELAELETFEGNSAAAGDAARAALSVAPSPSQMRGARTAFGQAVSEEILRTTLRSGGSSLRPDIAARVREAFELLEPIIQDEPGWRVPSRCQVLLGLLSGNGPGALRAWQSYYCLILREEDLKPLAKPARSQGDLEVVDGEWVHRPLPVTEPARVLAHLLPSFTADADAATRVIPIMPTSATLYWRKIKPLSNTDASKSRIG